MTPNSKNWTNVDFAILAVSFVPATVLTWGIHELAHYLTGITLGYEMWMTLNQAGPVQGNYDSNFHQIAVAIAGPILTWIQGVIAYFAVRWSRELWVYSFVFLTFWMRAVAMIVSFVSNPNDEAAAGILLGWPMFVIPALSVGFLFVLTLLASRTLKVGWKGNLVAYVAASFASTFVVFSDQAIF